MSGDPLALRATAAIAGLSVREAVRQRLWLIFALVALTLVVAIHLVTAVDPSGQRKLAVVVVSAGMGFLGTLLAMLVAASQLRRDLDARLSVMLFSKPLPRLGYLVGRALGILTVLLAGLAGVALVSSLAVTWRFGAVPEMRQLAVPDAWSRIASTTERVPIPSDRSQLSLAGMIGNGVVYHFSHLQPGEPRELLLRVDVRAIDETQSNEHVAVQAEASADNASWQALTLAPGSPYGEAAAGASGGRVQLRARDQPHRDLSLDYCRLILPAASISAGGESSVRLVRLDPTVSMVVDRHSSLYAAVPGGSFLANLLRAVLVQLSQAALLCTFTMFVVTISSLPVALLGGLTLYFAGNALWALRETLLYGEPGQALARLVHLGLVLLPDFERTGISNHLAGGEAIGWGMVLDGCAYFGAYSLIFLVLSWIALRRREL